ncbi:MAG: TIM barrel protein [Chitinivibrionales bacterium]|nr:TIM barrel protein [Chitinivibrionales bacterium]
MTEERTMQSGNKTDPFGYCLNTSTIKGTIEEKIEIAARAGYDGIEPWVRELDDYLSRGGSLRELRSRIEELGLRVVSLIAFFEWAVEDDQRRAAGLDEARRVMDLAWQMGCDRIAAPPSGLVDTPGLHLQHAAARYRALIDQGSEYGVIPILEFWGLSKSLGHLSEAAAVAIESGHSAACILVDIFHMYKRGSPFEGLRIVNGEAIGLVHINDYPADPPREVIKDAQRVFPGDGIAPLTDILADLYETGYRGMLSLELFNDEYYAQDPQAIVTTGLAKMRQQVKQAMARLA